MCSRCSISRNSSGVEMLYGRLPTSRSRAARRAARAKSNSSTSASWRCSAPLCRGRLAQVADRIAIDLDRVQLRAGVRSSGSVIAPRPGPISTRRSPGCGSIARDDALDHAGIVQEVLAEAFAGDVHAVTFSARAASCDGQRRWPRPGCPASAVPVPASVERRAVIDRRAHDRQAERDVDRAAEARVLDHRQTLVVIHREHRVALARACAA